MANQDSDFHAGHRERLRQKFLDDKLSDAEKLELMLGYIIPRRDVRVLSHQLISEFGNLSGVLTAQFDKLVTFKGMGRNSAIFIKLINQLMLDGYKFQMKQQPFFHNPDVLYNYCLNLFAGKTVEEFHVLFLDGDSRLLEDWTHTCGTVNTSEVYPREIVQRAMALNSRRLVLLHNHPSAQAVFSQDDAITTQRLANLLHAIGIELFDHLLIAGGVVNSAKSAHIFIPPHD